MEAWVERQKPQTRDKFRKVITVVLSDTNFWKNLDMCSRIFESVLQDLCVSDGMKGGTPSSTICVWVWTSSTVNRLTVSRNPRVASCMPCSLHGGIRFTHLCTVASSWTKHSAAWNMTMRRERTFSKSWRRFLKQKMLMVKWLVLLSRP